MKLTKFNSKINKAILRLQWKKGVANEADEI